MIRAVIFTIIVILSITQLGFIGLGLGGGAGGGGGDPRITGLQTNMVELTRFHNIWVAENGTGTATTDRNNLRIMATQFLGLGFTQARSLDPGDWSTDPVQGVCTPGRKTVARIMPLGAATVLSLAIYGAPLAIETPGTGAVDAYFACAKTHILEFTAMTDCGLNTGAVKFRGAVDTNGCIEQIAVAATNIIEAAWLMEDAGYTGAGEWETANRLTLARWARDEVFYLTSWGIQAKKNYLGILSFTAPLAIAAYGEYFTGFDNVTEWAGTTSGIVRTPTQYLNVAGDRLITWLGNSVDPLDSACRRAGRVYGLQPYGGFAEALGADGFQDIAINGSLVNCGRPDLFFTCGNGPSRDCDDGGVSTTAGSIEFLLQQDTTTALTHTCEIFRRIDMDFGSRCFDLRTHTNNPASNEALYDAIKFSTTQLSAPGGNVNGIFKDYHIDNLNDGMRYVASTYYNDYCMYNALDDQFTPAGFGGAVVGGNEYPFTRITHREGVAYPTNIPATPQWDCSTWNTSNWGT